MIILAVKTDQQQAEVGLFDSQKKLEYIAWQAHRELATTIHEKINDLIKSQDLSWQDIQGLIFYEGPGSFTGLRIGASVVNTMASELDIPIAGTSGENWIEKGLKSLKTTPEKRLIVPKYGSEPKVTQPKK